MGVKKGVKGAKAQRRKGSRARWLNGSKVPCW